MREADGTELVVFEVFAESREEGINGGLVHHRAFLKTFALDSPIVARSGAGHQVNARVLSAKVAAGGKFIPKPYIGEQGGVARVSLQICLHEPLELVAFVAFGEGVLSEMGKNGMEWGLAHFSVQVKVSQVGKDIEADGNGGPIWGGFLP